jgi:hypothetical protein
MARQRVSATRVINAGAEATYAVLADYHEGHRRILPRQYFPSLHVEEGGHGAGTVIRFEMRMFGRMLERRARVEEPQPGRVLVERIDDDRNTVTTFVVEPLGVAESRVTIMTEWKATGMQAVAERLLAGPALRRVLGAELDNLADYLSAVSR